MEAGLHYMPESPDQHLSFAEAPLHERYLLEARDPQHGDTWRLVVRIGLESLDNGRERFKRIFGLDAQQLRIDLINPDEKPAQS